MYKEGKFSHLINDWCKLKTEVTFWMLSNSGENMKNYLAMNGYLIMTTGCKKWGEDRFINVAMEIWKWVRCGKNSISSSNDKWCRENFKWCQEHLLNNRKTYAITDRCFKLFPLTHKGLQIRFKLWKRSNFYSLSLDNEVSDGAEISNYDTFQC